MGNAPRPRANARARTAYGAAGREEIQDRGER